MLPAIALVLSFVSPSSVPTLNDRIAAVLPTKAEDKWLQVPWRTNVMQARLEAQQAKKPLFMWIMVGNPQGAT